LFKELTESTACLEYRLVYIPPAPIDSTSGTGTSSIGTGGTGCAGDTLLSWSGLMTLVFGSVSSSKKAAEKVCELLEKSGRGTFVSDGQRTFGESRDDDNCGQSSNDQSSNGQSRGQSVITNVIVHNHWANKHHVKKWKDLIHGKSKWSDGVMLVKNIGASITERRLSRLFPHSFILIPKQNTIQPATRFAYVSYNTKEELDQVLDKYKNKRVELDGRRLLLVPFYTSNTGEKLPPGMLSLAERLVVLQRIQDLTALVSACRQSIGVANTEVIHTSECSEDRQ